MILVTGASGAVGAAVARRLAAAGLPTRLLARDPRRITLRAPNVETVAARFGERDSLASAFEGVERVFLSTNDPLHPEHDANLLEAAVRAGVKQVVRLSALMVTDPGTDDLVSRWHRACEGRIAASGLAWTFVRPRSFMSNTLAWAGAVREGVVRVPCGSARVACVDPRDVAHVAVCALTEPGHDGQAYAVTGPAAITAAEQVAVLAEVSGREVRFEEISVEEACRELTRRYPQPIADALAEHIRRRATNVAGQIEPAVELVTGRPAASFGTWARDHAQAFR